MSQIGIARGDLLNGLRIVVLESPYDTWDHPVVERLFGRIVGLKLKGYKSEYAYGILPVDTNDLISTHLLICKEDERRGELSPILGFRSTSLSKCAAHSLPFPALSLVMNANATPHDLAIAQLMADAQSAGKDIVYTGSWTTDPDARTNKDRAQTLKELFTTLYVTHHLERGAPWIVTGATLRFKVDRFIQAMGHHQLTYSGATLLPIQVRHLAGERVGVHYLKEFSEEAIRTANKYADLWRNRLEIKATEVSASAEREDRVRWRKAA